MPTEPAAVTTPNAVLRRRSSTTVPTAPSRTTYEVPLSARPTRSPRDPLSCSGSLLSPARSSPAA